LRALTLPRFVFSQTFNKVHYKGHQREIMEAAIVGSDVLVIAPTGMGKSMCFQVPAVADEHGLTLVLSPLLCECDSSQPRREGRVASISGGRGADSGPMAIAALMQDQVESLKSIGVAAAMLSSKTSQEEQNAVRLSR
jgi:superfamily II DNA helicase RecQ